MSTSYFEAACPLPMPDTFGKFSGTVPSVLIMNYVQAHHLDLDFWPAGLEGG